VKVPAAARSMACPPPTEPVKLMKSKAAFGDQRLGALVIEEDVLEQAAGTPAFGEGRTSRSPASSVCVACLRMTELPAISAGRSC
jgi:hypothetical protein